MKDNFSDFLVDLACDPELQGRFFADPRAELARMNLTSEEQAALLSRNSRNVGEVLGASPGAGGQGISKVKPKPPGRKRPTPRKKPRKSPGSSKKR